LDFIERYLGFSPDHGDGSFEAMLLDNANHVNFRDSVTDYRQSGRRRAQVSKPQLIARGSGEVIAPLVSLQMKALPFLLRQGF